MIYNPYKENGVETITKSHTNYHQAQQDDILYISELQKNTNQSADQNWKLVESYYVSRLNCLHKEIEKTMIEDQRLHQSRDELLKEVVRLSQKSTELSLKNEALTRIIAEKENKITAFMYEESVTPDVTYAPLGVSLIDSTRPPSPKEEANLKKGSSLFRRISSRLSVRKTRHKQADDCVLPKGSHLSESTPSFENDKQIRKKRK
ncbi:unnamed protein product [Rhizopus stolonifer]